MIERFRDPNGGFFDTPADGEALVIRPKDLQDNATPSGNALACEALLKLAAFTDKGEYRDLAEQALKTISEAAVRYPTAFARWLSAADFALGSVKQVAVLGEAQDENFQSADKSRSKQVQTERCGRSVRLSSCRRCALAVAIRPLVDGKPTAYVCEGFVCRQPVTNVEIWKSNYRSSVYDKF